MQLKPSLPSLPYSQFACAMMTRAHTLALERTSGDYDPLSTILEWVAVDEGLTTKAGRLLMTVMQIIEIDSVTSIIGERKIDSAHVYIDVLNNALLKAEIHYEVYSLTLHSIPLI
jgi:hypothetical protein